MTEQDLWFEPVSLLSRCSLSEGLLWVWTERVPIENIYRQKNALENLHDLECERLNIPPVPNSRQTGAHLVTEKRLRNRNYGKMPRDAREYHISFGLEGAEALRRWLPHLIFAMELPATELFLKLRRGEIEALGKVLPDGVEVIDFLEDQNSYSRSEFDGLVDSAIPHDFWTMPGIDWLANAVTARCISYCDVSLSVEVLMRLFPSVHTPVESAEFVGDMLVVKEPTVDGTRHPPRRTPGRPPAFAWEAFHVEVAHLIKSGRMPE